MLGPCMVIAPSASNRFDRLPSAVISVSTTTKRNWPSGAEVLFHCGLAARRGLEGLLQQGALQVGERLRRNVAVEGPAFPLLAKLQVEPQHHQELEGVLQILPQRRLIDRKSTRLNSSHLGISY